MSWPSVYLCDCDELAEHQSDCPASPIVGDTMLSTMFNPWFDPPREQRFWGTWFCTMHGKLGDINGPVHYAICHPRRTGDHG